MALLRFSVTKGTLPSGFFYFGSTIHLLLYSNKRVFTKGKRQEKWSKRNKGPQVTEASNSGGASGGFGRRRPRNGESDL
jgi:hypothetical protein